MALQTDPKIHAILSAFEEGAFAEVFINDVRAWMPAGTLLTMYHCFHFADGKLLIYVETAHAKWMLERLKDGGVFFDVGAATGAMTIPFALERPSVKIFAFEPARRARDLLQATIKRNSISNVEVFGFAVSDADGSAAFRERNLDLSGQTPFLPETSTLSGPDDKYHDGTVSEIRTIKLDTFAEEHNLKNRDIVMKIDIEGYEANALTGALNLLRSNRVYLSIDIHARIHGEGTTETDCKDILGPLGYSFEMRGHVLLCEPAGAAA